MKEKDMIIELEKRIEEFSKKKMVLSHEFKKIRINPNETEGEFYKRVNEKREKLRIVTKAIESFKDTIYFLKEGI